MGWERYEFKTNNKNTVKKNVYNLHVYILSISKVPCSDCIVILVHKCIIQVTANMYEAVASFGKFATM